MTAGNDKEKDGKLIILVDGNALVHRAYHAIPPLSTSRTGEVTNAVYGFINMLFKVLKEFKPEFCMVAFDTAKPTFRHISFKEYKGQREPTPQDLIVQFDRVKQVLQVLGIPMLEKEGYEADDILGTLSKSLNEKGMEIIIVSGDNDELQLITPGVSVLLPQKTFGNTVLYDEAQVEQKYGIKASQIPDYKGLVGDVSDNIPGVPGIGDKTARKLIQQYHSLENIYQNIEMVQPQKTQDTLKVSRDIALRGKTLTTIVKDLPLDVNVESCRLKKLQPEDKQRLMELLNELEFYKLIKQLKTAEDMLFEQTDIAGKLPIEVGGSRMTLTVVQDIHQLEAALNNLLTEKAIFLETLAGGGSGILSELVAVGLASANSAFMFPLGGGDLFSVVSGINGTLLQRLKGLLENTEIGKIGHNLKRSYVLLTEKGIFLQNLSFDTAVASYLLGDKSSNLLALVSNRLGRQLNIPDSIKITGGGELTAPYPPVNDLALYMDEILNGEMKLYPGLMDELVRQNLKELFQKMEMPLIEVLAVMERTGICIDSNLLLAISRRLNSRLNELEQEIYHEAGSNFNINSAKQLGVVLFEKMNLPVFRKTRTGYSTDASTLNELKGTSPIINFILEYRQLSKLKSTYVDALPLLINRKTGRLHTIFNQTVTATGRLSSSEPNLQNIPIRGELGKEIRSAFISPPGSLLLRGDYSQIDLRVLAHLSGDEVLIEAFRRGEDIHSITAARIYGVDQSEVTSNMRRVGKTVNFGVIYGMSDYGLEQATELSRAEAVRFISTYFEKYPQVRQYLEKTKQQAKEQRYVHTLFGRRRYIPDINSPNYQLRSAAERMAINMPVQGTAADIIKIAMVKIYNLMEQQKLHSRMLLQIHDELLFEVPENEVELMKSLVGSIMSGAAQLKVPLKVDIGVGKNWAEME